MAVFRAAPRRRHTTSRWHVPSTPLPEILRWLLYTELTSRSRPREGARLSKRRVLPVLGPGYDDAGSLYAEALLYGSARRLQGYADPLACELPHGGRSLRPVLFSGFGIYYPASITWDARNLSVPCRWRGRRRHSTRPIRHSVLPSTSERSLVWKAMFGGLLYPGCIPANIAPQPRYPKGVQLTWRINPRDRLTT
jgi:hypothetical protein